MRKCLFFFLLLMVVMVCSTAAIWAVDQMLTVQVREAQMRGTPSFTGRLSATLSYGQTVKLLEEQGAWVRASRAGSIGWVHKSALSNRQLTLSSGAQDTAAKAGEREVAAAGKGFTAQTERTYRKSHAKGYAQVEAMLKRN
ncbi:MAG: SH3 domain-containing protein [Desulfovibrio sp.]|jgi:SH3-like domain-containing protein|nr:SH3 domain-containing protein [Desulfovibrio sp.]